MILRELEAVNADIIALQEVTAAALNYFLASKWANGYLCSHPISPSTPPKKQQQGKTTSAASSASPGSLVPLPISFDAYGTVLFARRSLSPITFCEQPFVKSLLQRRLVWATLTLFGKEIVAFSAHLESLPVGEKARQHQLRQMSDIAANLSSTAILVFMGDTNFCREEEKFVPGWRDAWLTTTEERPPSATYDDNEVGDLLEMALRDDLEESRVKGFTFDGLLNKNADCFRSRIDRIYYSVGAKAASGAEWSSLLKMHNFALFGLEACEIEPVPEILLHVGDSAIYVLSSDDDEEAPAAVTATTTHETKSSSNEVFLPLDTLGLLSPYKAGDTKKRCHPSDHFGISVFLTVEKQATK